MHDAYNEIWITSPRMRPRGVPYLPPPPDPNLFDKNKFKNHPLLSYRKVESSCLCVCQYIIDQPLKLHVKAEAKRFGCALICAQNET